MSEPAVQRFTVETFLVQFEGREGVWELHDGLAVALSPERVIHTKVKGEATIALHEAIQRANSLCEAFVQGLTVRIRDDLAFVPDALVVCPPPPGDVLAIDNPVIVVEVSSPATSAKDHGIKLESYFELPSVQHYLILDPDRRVVIPHRRGEGFIETRILHEGALRLEPPGLELAVAELFGPD